jgi:hypothetical protein
MSTKTYKLGLAHRVTEAASQPEERGKLWERVAEVIGVVCAKLATRDGNSRCSNDNWELAKRVDPGLWTFVPGISGRGGITFRDVDGRNLR